MISLVSKDDLHICREYILKCLEIGEGFDHERVYPYEHMEAICLLINLQSDFINSKVFGRLNDWFLGFANGIVEYNMEKEDNDLYRSLMNFSTQVCWNIDSMYWESKEEVYMMAAEI